MLRKALFLLPGLLLGTVLAHAQCVATFNYQAGGKLPAAVTCAIAGPASGSSTLSFTPTQPWISVSPASASVDAGQNLALNIGVNPAGLPQGTHSGQILASAGTPIPVTLTVGPPSAETPIGVSASPSTLTFSNSIGSAWPPVQSIQIASNPSGLPFNVSVSTTDGGNWLWTNASVGTAPALLSVGASGDAMRPGTYLGTVTITSPGSANPPQVIAVTLSVSSTVSFAYQVGSAFPPPKCFALNSSDPLKATTSGERWLNLDLSGASACLSINAAGLQPGNYSSTVLFPPSSLSLQVVLTVLAPTALSVDLPNLVFRYQPGWTPLYTLRLSSQNPSAGVSFNAAASTTSGGNWLSVSPSNGATPASLAVRVNADGMAPGSYAGQLTVTQAGGGAPPQTISVSLVIPEFRVSALPSAVSFTYELGLSVPAPKTVAVFTADTTGIPANMPFSAAVQSGQPWLSASSDASGAITVAVNPGGLAKGAYSGNIVVTAAGTTNSPVTVPVSFSVIEPTVVVQPARLFLDYQAGSPPPAQQTIGIASGSGQIIRFSASSVTAPETNWLVVNSSPGGLSANILADRLPQGIFRGTITVTSPNAANSPIAIPVTVRVRPRPGLQVRPASLSFTYDPLVAAPLTRTFALWGGSTDFTVTTSYDSIFQDWIDVTVTQSTTPARAVVTVKPKELELPAGTYTGSVVVQASGAVQTVPVTLVVGAHGSPAVSPAALVFEAQAGSGTLAQEVAVTYAGEFDPVPGAKWLSTSASTGKTGSLNGGSGSFDTTTTRFKVLADTSNFAPGTYTSTLTLTPADPDSPPMTLPVKLVVRPGNLTLPQIADGSGWKTGMVLVNADRDAAPYTVKFWQPDGTPLALALDGLGSLTEYSDTIPAGGSRTLQTQGAGNALTQGWAEIVTSKAIRGTVVFRQQVAGAPDIETAAPIHGPLDSRFMFALDDADGLANAVALVNPSAQPATVTIGLRDESGRAVGVSTLRLQAKQRVAFTIRDQFPASAGLRGVAEISTADGRLAAMSLRLRPGSMSSIEPVLPRTPAGNPDVSTISQISDGAGWRTKLLLVNSGTEPAPFSLAFWGPGGPLFVPIEGAGAVTEYSDTIPAGGVRVVATAGASDTLTQGWAELVTSKAIDGTVLLVQPSLTGAEQEMAASMAPAPSRNFLLPFDNTQGSITSLTLTSLMADFSSRTLYLDARDENGAFLASAGLPLDPREHKLLALTDFLPALAGRRGVVEFSGMEMGGLGFWSSPAGSMTAIAPIKR